jgi:hypothetical protein
VAYCSTASSRSCSSSANRLLPQGLVHPTPTGWGGVYEQAAATGTFHPQPTNQLGQLTTSHARGSIDASLDSFYMYHTRGNNGHCSLRGNQPAS